jgi:DNA-binding NarL/FixJ family response regulator
MTDLIRISIADDHPVLRRGLRQIIEEDAGLEVSSEADNGRALLDQIQYVQPRIVLLDADMPVLNGIETLREIRQRNMPVESLFLTIHDGADLFRTALELGARGFVLKQSIVSEIVEAIRTVASGRHYWSPELTPYLLQSNPKEPIPDPVQVALQQLTPSERRVFEMVAEGKSSKEIAGELFIHYKTVENHRSQICEKLGLQGPNSLSRFVSQTRIRFRGEV